MMFHSHPYDTRSVKQCRRQELAYRMSGSERDIRGLRQAV